MWIFGSGPNPQLRHGSIRRCDVVCVFGAESHIPRRMRKVLGRAAPQRRDQKQPGPAVHLPSHFTKQQRENERQKFFESAPAQMKSRFWENKSLRGGTVPC
jgi:hypothetical protein